MELRHEMKRQTKVTLDLKICIGETRGSIEDSRAKLKAHTQMSELGHRTDSNHMVVPNCFQKTSLLRINFTRRISKPST